MKHGMLYPTNYMKGRKSVKTLCGLRLKQEKVTNIVTKMECKECIENAKNSNKYVL